MPQVILYSWSNQYRLYRYIFILAYVSPCMEITPVLKGVCLIFLINKKPS